MDRKQIINYLETVFELEKMCYEQNCILARLKKRIRVLKNPQLNKKECNPCKPSLDLQFFTDFEQDCDGEGYVGLMIILYIIILVFMSKNAFNDKELPFLSAIFPALGVLLAIWLALHFIYIIVQIVMHCNDVSNYKKKVNDIIRKNIDIEDENKRLKISCNNAANKLQREGNQIYAGLQETQKILNNYFDLNIIYPKYRNMSCVAAMLEYFKSGRCDTLEGHEGAYNILENDIKFGKIISQFNIVIQKLDAIKDNQYMLYDAINECNRSVNNVSNQIISSASRISNQIEQASKQTSQQLDSIAYTNEIAARNTYIIGQIEAYKLLTSEK